MVEFPKIFWDHEGHAHTNALHWEGLPHLLWESLQLFCYTDAKKRYHFHRGLNTKLKE
jgi:hypothetical protein